MARPRKVTAETPEDVARRRENYHRWQENARARRMAVMNAPGYQPPATALPRPGVQVYAICDACEFLDYCNDVVWQGTVLPCQPQSEEAIVYMREDYDYLQNWQGSPTPVTLPRTHKHHSTQVER